MTIVNVRKPGIRIDGEQRRDLNKERVAERMATLPLNSPTDEDRRARHSALARREQQERKDAKTGHDGSRTAVVKIKLSQGRFGHQTVRAKPGTFEWRYGRNKQDALFHAGNHLAILWERAGMTIASSADFLRGTKAGYPTGLAEGRAAALDSLSGFVEEMGRVPAQRLVDYCVCGQTTAEIARRHGATERAMAPVLDQDLRACAGFFSFLDGSRR